MTRYKRLHDVSNNELATGNTIKVDGGAVTPLKKYFYIL